MTAVSNHLTTGSAFDSAIQNILICSQVLFLFVCVIYFSISKLDKTLSGRRKTASTKDDQTFVKLWFVVVMVNAGRTERNYKEGFVIYLQKPQSFDSIPAMAVTMQNKDKDRT